MKNKSGTKIAKIGSAVLSLSLGFSLVPFLSDAGIVRADDSDEPGKIINVSDMARPVAPLNEASDAWTGSFVYLGNYEGYPVRFRVLDPDSNDFGSNTLFLDCDTVLFYDHYDVCGAKCDGLYPYDYDYAAAIATGDYEPCLKTEKGEWSSSSINSYLNSDDFLDKIFTPAEQGAIANSYQDSHPIRTNLFLGERLILVGNYLETTPLTGEKIFLLDVDDVLNRNYGYIDIVGSALNSYNNIRARQKKLISYFDPDNYNDDDNRNYRRYYLRTNAISVEDTYTIASVHEYGWMNSESREPDYQHKWTYGISPALNIDKSDILYATCISGVPGEVNAEYILTFIDPDLKLQASANVTGNTVTVPYDFNSNYAGQSQISVLITDKEYSDPDSNILYHETLDTVEGTSANGSATFTWPEGTVTGTCGTDYHVYIIAETVNGQYESRSSSIPTEITVNTVSNAPVKNEISEDNNFEGFVERLYEVALGRASEEEGKAFWAEHVKNCDLTGADCAREFLNSDEFNSRNLTNEEFLAVLYKVFFDRDSKDDPNGSAYWLDVLKTESRYAVINGFIDSTEWCNVCASYGVRSGATTAKATEPSKNTVEFVKRLYTICLGRDSDSEGLNYWSLGLTNQEFTGTQAVREFIYSREFQDKGYGNEEYITKLYEAFMDREPDNEGLSYWNGLLEGGTSRDEVFDSFAGSDEFTDICNSYAINR